MKKLFLLRHAEAPSIKGKSDRERTLSTTGKEECKILNKYFKSHPSPQLIISSDSIRTKATVEHVFKQLPYEVIYTNHLYNTSQEQLLEIIKNTTNVESLMLVGHNPSITSLGESLQIENRSEFSNISNYHATAKLVVLKLNSSNWDDINSHKIWIDEIFIPLTII